MSAWTPEAQAMFERITSHYKPYDIEPTLKERTLLVSRLTIVATERLDLGALLSARFQWLSTFFVSSENIFKKSLDRGGVERYPLCIESPGYQATHLVTLPSSNTLSLRLQGQLFGNALCGHHEAH